MLETFYPYRKAEGKSQNIIEEDCWCKKPLKPVENWEGKFEKWGWLFW